MKQVMKKVRHKGKVVSEIEVPIYESLEELADDMEETKILSIFNNGNHIRLMGNERAKFSTTTTGKKARMKIAFELLSTDELMAVAQNADALNEKLMSDEMQQRVDEHLKASSEAPEAPEAPEAVEEA